MRRRFVVIDARREAGDAPDRDVGLDRVPGAAGRRRLQRHPAEAIDVDPRLHAPGQAEQRRQRLERQRAAPQPAPRLARAQCGRQLRVERRRRQRRRRPRRGASGAARHGDRRRRLARLLPQRGVGHAARTEADVARRVRGRSRRPDSRRPMPRPPCRVDPARGSRVTSSRPRRTSARSERLQRGVGRAGQRGASSATERQAAAASRTATTAGAATVRVPRANWCRTRPSGCQYATTCGDRR